MTSKLIGPAFVGAVCAIGLVLYWVPTQGIQSTLPALGVGAAFTLFGLLFLVKNHAKFRISQFKWFGLILFPSLLGALAMLYLSNFVLEYFK